MRELQAEFQRGLLDGCDPDRDVLVFAAHLYVEGAVPSYTERPVDISDTLPDRGRCPPAGQLCRAGPHPPARRPSPGQGMTARYAGSPLQLDFGEAGEDKSVVVVDADPGRPVRVELVPLHAGRRLADFTGTLEELRAAAPAIGDAFVRAVIVSDEPIPDLAAAAKEAAPRATFVAIEPRCAASQVAVLEQDDAEDREPDLPDLFREYLHGPRARTAPSPTTSWRPSPLSSPTRPAKPRDPSGRRPGCGRSSAGAPDTASGGTVTVVPAGQSPQPTRR